MEQYPLQTMEDPTMDIPEGNGTWGEPTLEQIFLKDCNLWRVHIRAEENWERKDAAERNH